MIARSLFATLWATLAVAASFTSPARAQNAPPPGGAPAAAPAGQRIAVIDLNYLFKNHARFNAAKEDMKHDVEQAEEQLKAQREEIRRLVDQLQQFKPGSPEYKQLETQIATRQAQISADVQIRKKEFMEQEAKIYFQAYQEILDEVRYFASRNAISMVIKVNDEPVDPNDPNAVLEELKKPVLFSDASVNITQTILAAVNGRQAGGGAAPARTPQRVGGAPAPGGPAATVPRTGATPRQPNQPVPR